MLNNVVSRTSECVHGLPAPRVGMVLGVSCQVCPSVLELFAAASPGASLSAEECETAADSLDRLQSVGVLGVLSGLSDDTAAFAAFLRRSGGLVVADA